MPAMPPPPASELSQRDSAQHRHSSQCALRQGRERGSRRGRWRRCRASASCCRSDCCPLSSSAPKARRSASAAAFIAAVVGGRHHRAGRRCGRARKRAPHVDGARVRRLRSGARRRSQSAHAGRHAVARCAGSGRASPSSGLLQIVFAAARMGSIVSYVPLPVLAGFMDGDCHPHHRRAVPSSSSRATACPRPR